MNLGIEVNNRSSPEDKIELFRSLFRGRDDVYPRRFESRTTGKSGYAPVCSNEWVRGICEKPRVKCASCQHRQFLPVTDEVIRWHLSGRDDRGAYFVAGVYPMLLDETCFFLAIDFDKAEWAEDTAAVLDTCHQVGVPAYLERSRSGNGGHVWIFFDEAIPVTIARRLGSHILTETMERRPEIGLDSYDRFFPNQDTLPRVTSRRVRQSDRLAVAEAESNGRQQRVCECFWKASRGSMGLSGVDSPNVSVRR